MLEMGFLPFFSNEIPGFSIEEQTPAQFWFNGDIDGPWEWKGPVITGGMCAYGKFFRRKAGYVSLEWLPDFINMRREHYHPTPAEQQIYHTLVDNESLLSKELNVIGLVNIQYVVYNHEVFVIEVNPRSSRTVPYISKVTGIPMVDIATKIMFGAKLKDMGYESGLYPAGDYVAVKVPVFSFEKLTDVDTMLGPEMKSTGECLGIGRNLEDALLKGLIAAGFDLKREGGVLISVRDSDKREILPIADKFERMGFELYATSGTQSVLHRNMIAANLVRKISDGEPNVETLLDSGKIHYVISTSAKGRLPERDSVKMRRKSIERSICSLTAVDTAKSLVKVLESGRTINDVELVDITKI